MLNQSRTLTIHDNAINEPCMILLLVVLLVIIVSIYFIDLYLNKKKIEELSQYKKLITKKGKK